jgi:hypothetical protein
MVHVPKMVMFMSKIAEVEARTVGVGAQGVNALHRVIEVEGM